jgi:hypothetical protein
VQARAAIVAALGRPSHDANAGAMVREALRAAGCEARERCIRPEALLETLKEGWASLPAVRDSEDSNGAMQEVIERSLRAYFAG